MRLIRTIILLILIIGAQVLQAQNNTISPYSRYGLGLYEQNGFGRGLAMGGTGIALQARGHVNNINPASYALIDSSMVLFDVGLHLDYEYISTYLDDGDKTNGNISYFSLAVSGTRKWAFSFGIAPYTSTGYTIRTREYLSGGGQTTYISHVEGIGGLTRVYAGLGVQLGNRTAFGMNASVLFGPKTQRQAMVLNASDIFSIYVENTDYYVGGKLDFGLQHRIPTSKKSDLTLGVIASTPGILRCDRTEKATNTFISGVTDTIYYDDDDYDRYTTLPMTCGAGVAFNYNERVTFTADFNYNPLSKLKVSDKRSKLIDNQTINVGAEFIPQRLGRKYDLTFRAGASYESGTYRVDDYRLKAISGSFGVGFRIRTIRFNTFCSYRQQGTKANLLVLDQRIRLGLNLTYIDYWFQKRKFY